VIIPGSLLYNKDGKDLRGMKHALTPEGKLTD
jgi:hypothetical protein